MWFVVMEIDRKSVRVLSMLGPNGAFGAGLLDAAEKNNRVVALTADLRSFAGLDRFAAQYRNRFYNIGIAEQNMINVAAGMAADGLIPFATSYATFASMRCADQIRVSMGYMGLSVKLIGLTSGYSVGILGPTHISIEDLAVMRSIPNITIVSPADGLSTYKAILAATDIEGPVYIRLTGAMGMPVVYSHDFDFQVGKCIALREGADVLIIASGSMVAPSLKAADALSGEGTECTVLDMHTIKPLDTDAVRLHAEGKRLIVTVEEHSVCGGLGSAVLECLADHRATPVKLIGCPDAYPHAEGYKALLENAGLTSENIVASIVQALNTTSE